MKSVNFKYLDLGSIGGRGGTLRFFLLANGIPYDETLYPMGSDEWVAEKARLISSGENPCGTVPVVYNFDSNSIELSQHIAICRFVARSNKVDSGDAFKDYIQDMMADEYQGFRDMWVRMVVRANDDEKAEYRTKTLPETLAKFEALYKKYKTADPYLSTNPAGNPLWGDAAIFSIIYDNIQTGFLTQDTLVQSYPNLAALYQTFAAIPAVVSWINEHKRST